MVQIISPSPRAMQAGDIGKALGMGAAKQAGMAEAENAFRQSQGDPLKLATAMGRLLSVSPDMARAAGPMYDAMLRNMQSDAIRKGAGSSQSTGQIGQALGLNGQTQNQPEALSQQQQRQIPIDQGQIPVNQTTPGIQQTGIAGEEMLPKPFWTQQERLNATKNYLDMGFLPDKAEQLAREQEASYMANPGQYQKRYELLEQKKKDSIDELKRQLETKTQKQGPALFKDIPGEYLIGMEKGLQKDIIENPNKTVSQIADEWSTKALNTAKAKNQLEKLGATEGFENLIKGTSTLDKLESYAKIFEKTGNQEEYFNLLQSNFGVSPQGASSVAFKIRPELKNIVEKDIKKFDPADLKTPRQSSIKLANNLIDKLSDNDSLLSIAWEARKKNNNFDQKEFFKRINDNQDIYNLNARQQREAASGATGLLPTWGDVLIFPWTRDY